MKFCLSFLVCTLVFLVGADAQLTANPYQYQEHNTIFMQGLMNGQFDGVNIFHDEARIMTGDQMISDEKATTVNYWTSLDVEDVRITNMMTTYSWKEIEKNAFFNENIDALQMEGGEDIPALDFDNLIFQLVEVEITKEGNDVESFPMLRVWQENGAESLIVMDSFQN